MNALVRDAIPQEVLAEQYYMLLHSIVGQLQSYYRHAPGLSQKIIAERTSKQPAVVSRCLSGQENMTVRTMHDLARGMGCRLQVNLVPLHTIPPANRSLAIPYPAPTQIGGATEPALFNFDKQGVTKTVNGTSTQELVLNV